VQVDKHLAHDKVEKEEVKAQKHAKEAQALREKQMAKDQNALEKEATKEDLANRKAAAKEAYHTPGAAPGNVGPGATTM
jgi:hypothetical protein